MIALFDNILLALESLRTNKMRAVLTMLGIVIGIGSVIAINTVGSSLTGSVSDSISSLGASSITVSLTQKESDDDSTSSNVSIKMFASSTPDDSDLITDEMIEEYRAAFPDDIAYIELTDSVGTATASSATDSSTEISANVTGVNDEYADAEEVEMLYGRFIDNDSDTDRRVCVCSDVFVENVLGIDAMNAIGSSVTLTINNMPYQFYIEGVYAYEEETVSSSDDDEDADTDTVTDLYIPLECAATLSGSRAGYQSFTVVSSSETDTSTFMQTTGDYFASYYTQNDTWTVEATSLEEVVSILTSIISTISYAIATIVAISLVVGGIGVVNIMLVSIMERTREIGTRKAIGASNNSIRLQFLTESVVICLIGGIIGVLLGLILGAVISNALGYSASPSVATILGAVGFSMLVDIIFGYAPSNKAAKLDPIEALRHE
ncbi:MAG: ABC transporter permease [Clostridiales bacterium]|nr:ABC transporter permease [Clostridiales bacterium]